MSDLDGRPDDADAPDPQATVIDHVAASAAAPRDAQAEKTIPPVDARRNTRFLRALRALRVADMATLAPAVEGDESPPVTGTAVDGDGLLAVRHDDKYRVGRELGRGGMGIVRKTRDEHLQRHVAMKTLRDGPEADARLAALLVREARLTGQLEHPNIVPVYDLGTLEDGSFFYTMRLYRETTLATILQGLREGDPAIVAEYDLEGLLQSFRQACMALAFAHARGVVHRDVKPGNILVGDYGEVQVTDWGVAQVTPDAAVSVPPISVRRDERHAADPGRGRGVDLVGTPHYMAPEQARGEHGVDPRSDIYSLGVLLYEILTLRLPYDETRDLDELLPTIAEGRIAPPEDRNPDRPVPEELAAILRKALARDPTDRYPTARALWEAVAEWSQGTRQRKRRAERATAEIGQGAAASRRYFDILEERQELSEHIAALQARVKPWHPLSERQRVWTLRDQRDRLEIHLGKAFSVASDHYVRALVHESDNPVARSSLARLYWSKLVPAIERNDYQDIVYYGGLVRSLSDPREGPLEAGTATVSIRSLPEGATIRIHDIADLSPDPSPAAPTDDDGWEEPSTSTTPPLGQAPLMDLSLPSGVHIFVARADGYREARRPVLLQAGAQVQVLLSLSPLHEDRPMVGRDGELGRMKALYQSACENRRPAFCLVHAAPGMGKTKLLEAFEDFLQATRESVFLCYAEPRRTHPQLPFAPLADLFAFRAGIKLEDSRETRERKLVEMARLALSRNGRISLSGRERLVAEETAGDLGLLPGLVDPPRGGDGRRARGLSDELEPAQIRRRIFKGVTTYFETLAAWHPVYLRIRAAHRLDRSTREALGRLRGAGAIFVLGDVSSDEVDGGLRALFDALVALPAFDPLSVERFVANYLDGAVDAALVDALVELSRGRPGHLEVLLPLLAETGLVVRESGRWGLAAGRPLPAEELGYNQAVERLTFGPLSAGERRVLDRAAVAGRVFSREELVALGCVEPDALTAALTERQVIRHRPTAGLLWTEVYAFATDTLWEIAYGEIPPRERRDLHLQLARYLASIPHPSAEGVALMADHYARAGRRVESAACLSRLADHARSLAAVEEEALNHRMAEALRGGNEP